MRRGPRPRGATKPVVEPLRDIIGRYLQRSGLSHRLRAAELQAAWEEALGADAAHTRLDAVRQNVAVFVVDSAALLAELNNFRKDELLAALQGRLQQGFVRDIKFRLGSLRRRPGSAADGRARAP